ncbi:MAG: glycogen/starch/alpha-glucan phosphorylase [Phycisphaerales bacterium]|nr:MAG: glycogen/starch/alpha-glucan phosphorylase [Phycisphaerales bacterium]
MTVLDAKSGACDERRGLNVESLRNAILSHVSFTQATVPEYATPWDIWVAVAMSVRDRLNDRWIATRNAYYNKPDTKRVYYLSLEFLMGRALGNSLVNLGLYDEYNQALKELGYDLEDVRDLEEEAGLGNGGLGRLAACFLDSMATLELPGYGYGLRYDYGMFHQRIRDGYQVEEPDDWLRLGNPWEIARPEDVLTVQFHGRVDSYIDEKGNRRRQWVDTHDVHALPYDMPIPGYRNNTVNTLRLFSAKATREFDLAYFNHGDYLRACQDKSLTENVTRVLYPNDQSMQGRELRLQQEHLLVSSALQEILNRFRAHHDDWNLLPDRAAIQLNDTHPALAVAELMRLLLDHHGLTWNQAWEITTNTLAYTNHTVMPEALEKWSVKLLGQLLPRHLEIIFEINRRFLDDVHHRYPGDGDRRARMSIIEEGEDQKVRMAHLAAVGSHSINGVSALHTEIVKREVMRDFHEFWPDKFNNKTNGITPRRWLRKANIPLSRLINEAIGEDWIRDLDQLRKLIPMADDEGFQAAWREAKRLNKVRLAAYVQMKQDLIINPEPLLDCQVKRIHDYKRQILNLLHVVTLYNRLKAGRAEDFVPRTVLLAGKAAPGYHHAKMTIKLATAIGEVVNHDPDIGDRLKLVVPENYCVALAEFIIPAAELSEQISTAGMEASGTGNMKFALNGALTIGTFDGANIEIREEVGEDNFFLFGLTAEEIEARKAAGYDPRDHYHANEELRTALDQISGGFFSPTEPGLFRCLTDRLLEEGDPYMVLADYESYVECQQRVSRAYGDQAHWTRKSILNTARMGKFSSDRTIRQYAEEVWKLRPVPVSLEANSRP